MSIRERPLFVSPCSQCRRYKRGICSSCHKKKLDECKTLFELKTQRLRRELQSAKESHSTLKKEFEELDSTLRKKFESRLDFLCLWLDNEHAKGTLKADVAILVQDRREEILYAHKFVLASKSPVFCKMFEIDMPESEKGLVRIDDATLPVMRAVIDFCYNGEPFDFTEEVTCEEVLEVAHKYRIDILVKICEELLIQTMDKVNLSQRLKVAKKFDSKILALRALEYLKTHYKDVIVAVLDQVF